MKLTVKANTVLKIKPVQSNELSDREKISLAAGDYEIKEFEDKGNHLLITLATPLNERAEWYIFEDHIDLLTLESKAAENADKAEPKKQGLITIPGGKVYLGDSIANGNFSWTEATKNGSRIPESKEVVSNIITMAKKMEEVRDFLGGRVITVTSWYRDPVTNRRVGGASRSTHIQGHGVDFNVDGLSPKQVQQKLESFWRGGMGYGRTFTHLDNRNYKARWNYGA